jgi:hypothetical protein
VIRAALVTPVFKLHQTIASHSSRGFPMRRTATALGFLLLAAAPAFAQQEFEPTAPERKTIGDCIEKTAGDYQADERMYRTRRRSLR